MSSPYGEPRGGNQYQDLKSALLQAGSHGELPVQDLVDILDWLSNV